MGTQFACPFFVLWCRATVGGALLYVLFATANFQSATAHQQCHHQNQTGWVDVEVEVSNFAPTATQKQHHKQNPSAVATAKATAVVCAATIVKQTVEHCYLPLPTKGIFFCSNHKPTSQYGNLQKSVTKHLWRIVVLVRGKGLAKCAKKVYNLQKGDVNFATKRFFAVD